MRLLVSAAVLTIAGISSAAAAPGTCPIEKTVYRLTGNEKSAELRFIDNPAMARQTHLSAVIKSNVTGKSYKYYIAVSNGYSTHYLVDASKPAPPVMPNAASDKNANDTASTENDEDKSPSFSFYNFDSLLHVMNLPNLHEQGPQYIFIPDLGVSLWYAEMAPGQKAREAIETEMWHRAECIK